MTVFTHFITHTGSYIEHMHPPLLRELGVRSCPPQVPWAYEGFSTLLKGTAQEVSSDLSCYQELY